MASNKNKSVYVLSSNYTIYPLLSRGCLFPPALELSDEYSKEDDFFKYFLLEETKVNSLRLKGIETQTRNVFPIIIELDSSPIKRNFGLAKKINFINLDGVKGLIFRNEKELKRFKFAAFDDINVEKLFISLRVQLDCFDTPLISNMDVDAENEILNSLSEADVSIINREIAFYWSLLKFPVINSELFRFLKKSFMGTSLNEDLGDDAETFQCIKCAIKGIPINNKDWRFQFLYLIVSDLSSDEYQSGWAPANYLEKNELYIKKFISQNSENYDDNSFSTWFKTVKGVLNQDTTFPNLADSKDIILRALMLFVIYRKPEALKSIRENKSYAELGERVWLIAAVISVSTIGMRKLPADLKFSEAANENRNFLNFLASILTSKFVPNPKPVGSMLGGLNVEINGNASSFSYSICHKKNRLIERSIRLDTSLSKAITDCQYYEFETRVISPNSFQVISKKTDEFKVPVNISTDSENKILSCSVNVTNPNLGFLEPAKKSKRLSRDYLEELLALNFRVGINCRVGIDELNNIWLRSDQLLDTMDREEVVFAIKNIKELASKLMSS